MGGFFGISSDTDCLTDVFFGVDYHSHLGTKNGGIAAYDPLVGLQRQIHNIENTPFRSKFGHVLSDMKGIAAIGCISDYDPQPLLVRSNLGNYALSVTGVINNSESLISNFLSFSGGHFNAMTGGRVNSTELVAALINQKSNFTDGILFAQEVIEGTASILILTDDGTIIAARDKVGRLPVQLGTKPGSTAVAFEAFSYQKMDYEHLRELGPGEIVSIKQNDITVLSPPKPKKRICAFLWSYYGYPTSTYEGMNVEAMRYKNGAILAQHDEGKPELENVDYVGGVPDSGTPHAIGYANESGKHFARAFIKYTPTWSRSFMPTEQTDRDRIAKMKQIPVQELIKGKSLLFVDDSIVRGTQLRETVDFLYENGAREVHMRSACPPIMYGCKFLNFSRATSDMELISRRTIVELEGEEGLDHLDEYADAGTERGKALRTAICEKLHFASLEFQSLEGVVEAIGLPECELCTYCWNGKE
ncbi:MAG: amidophosphoribosyltransferase [Lachnospiraceae bacterium]|nr:amidophosphoribosyltransferase [Lachnospiraceae bacterium]